ncbi:MAG: hypothetical protein AAB729_03395 [Patescibacteria group bacterium]
MPTSNYAQVMPANNYDPRWFIWTIVFLVVTGISLVSYIVLSDNGTNDVPDFTPARSINHKTTSQK